MTKWKLNTDGDKFEKDYGPIIQDKFPNYEVFWSEFIVSMTCRNNCPKDHPLYIHPKKDVDSDLQNISMSHYTIFRCFILAHELIHLRQSETCKIIYEDRLNLIYSNFGTIIDMVSNIFFFIAKLQFRFGVRNTLITKKSHEELEQDLQEFYEDYDNRILSFEKNKRPINVTVHKMANFISDVLGKSQEVDLFSTFSQRIRAIRNAAIHNPIIGSVNEKFIPKLGKLKKYYFWGDIVYNANLSDFIDKEQMFIADFEQLSSLLNSLWNKMIPKYQKISKLDDFDQLLGTACLFKSCPECIGNMQYSEVTRNCAPLPNSYNKSTKEFTWSSCSINHFKTSYWSCQSCEYKELINVGKL